MSRYFSPTSFAAGIIVGALLGYSAFTGLGIPAPLQLGSDVPRETQGLLTGTPSGAVSVADQKAGNSVMVESVTVPPPGVWVAVRDVVGTDLGNVLGAARVTGPQTNVAIPLLRATVTGMQYAVELYRDSGDMSFDVAGDSVYVDLDSGERVVAYFKTTP